MSSLKATRTVLLVVALVLGVAACGDDDGSESGSASASGSGSGSGSGSVAKEEAGDFCESLEAFNDAIFDTDLEEATEEDAIAAHGQLEPLWSAVKASAPDEVSDSVDALTTSIDALAEGDTEAFNSDDTSAQYFGMVGDVVADCVDEVVEVTAVDYAFEGVPETFPAGASGIRFTNDSENSEPHEFIVFKKADGETRSAEEILNDPAAEEQGPGEFSGAVFAYEAGITGGGFLDLTPGNYLAVCFVPVGGGEEGPPHFTQGMLTDFSVE